MFVFCLEKPGSSAGWLILRWLAPSLWPLLCCWQCLLPTRWQRAVEILNCVVALAFCLGLTWLGIRIAWSAYSFGDRSSTGLSFPMWIYYSALPAGGLLMSVRYIGRLYRFCFRYDPATMTIGALHHEPIAAGK